MCPDVFVLKDGNELVEMEETQFAAEADFQELLEKFPALLSGGQIDPAEPRKWIFVAREQGIPSQEGAGDRWAVDHLFLDQDGVATLVEVKRSTDTRLRREVVGQMLDYAANAVVYWPPDTIRRKFETGCEKQGVDPADVLLEKFDLDATADEYWNTVELNLRAGRIRLLFVADVIPAELQRIIEFLNEQMKPAEVLGVEIRHYMGEGMKTLVPRVVGLTSQALRDKSTGSAARTWDEQSFFSEIQATHGAQQVAVARRLYEWMKAKHPNLRFGQGAQNGSISSRVLIDGNLVRGFTLWTSLGMEIAPGPLREYPPFSDIEKRRELIARLKSIEGLEVRDDPNSPWYFGFESLNDTSRLDAFVSVLDWISEKISSQSKDE